VELREEELRAVDVRAAEREHGARGPSRRAASSRRGAEKTMRFPSDPFIDGAWRSVSTRAPIRAPYDDALVDEVGLASARDLDDALRAGARAEHAMRARPLHARRALLARTARLIVEHAESLARLIAREAAKPIALARVEVARAATTFTLAHDALAASRDRALPLDVTASGEGRYGVVKQRPRGLALAITPFNFPLNLVAHKVAPALAAGCPVIVKPADQAPLTALALAALLEEAGAPPGAVQVVPTTRALAGALVDDDRTRVLSFTGSSTVGFALRARAAKKHSVLELGGDAAVVVCADSDVAAAAEKIARGAFAYAGQVCISVQRVFVDARVRAPFVDALVAAARALVTGDPLVEDTALSALIDDAAKARVTEWIDEATMKGARALLSSTTHTGGARRALTPCVLEGVPETARLAREEAFGPVCVVDTFRSIDEAAARVNASRFGLQTGIFTDSVKDLWRFSDLAEVGAVIHDDVPTFRVDHMPYGGVKDSGRGREGLPDAIADYEEPRLLVLRA